jgi:hypothetical protein
MTSGEVVVMSGAEAAPVAAAIAGWRPSGAVGERAQAFARAVVTVATPATPGRARALLFAAARLAVFGESVGLEPRPEVLLHASVIERLIVREQPMMSPATRRTLRTNLRYLARCAGPQTGPAPVALPRGPGRRRVASSHRP